MTKIGYGMLILGFLFGAYATSLDVEAVTWNLFIPAGIVAVAGLVVIKRSTRSAAQAEHVLTANRETLTSALDNVIEHLDAIVASRRAADSLGTDALRAEIDDRLREDFRRFVEVRESMVHLYGIQAYADIMSDFAAGERQVNRVWSASTDGYGDEANLYLDKAAISFRSARERLREFVNAA